MRKAIAAELPRNADSEIDLTPMLDVVFIMLIFFIVTASFVKESGIDLNRSDSLDLPLAENASILIDISENNEIWMDRRLIDHRALRSNIARTLAEKPDATVVIQADKRSSNKVLVQVMDASRAVGIYDVAIAADDD